MLEAMGEIPRERFVPPDLVEHAYADGALTIGGGQTISQPYIVARMSEALRLAAPRDGDRSTRGRHPPAADQRNDRSRVPGCWRSAPAPAIRRPSSPGWVRPW